MYQRHYINTKTTSDRIQLSLSDVKEIFKGRHSDLNGWNIQFGLDGYYAEFTKHYNSDSIEYVFEIRIFNKKMSEDRKEIPFVVHTDAMDYIQKLEREQL